MTANEFMDKYRTGPMMIIYWLEVKLIRNGRRILRPDIDPLGEEDWGYEEGTEEIDFNQLELKNRFINIRDQRNFEFIDNIRNCQIFIKFMHEDLIRDLLKIS